MWTLVGGGLKTLEQSAKPMKSVLHSKCHWIKSKAVNFDPEKCVVKTENGDEVKHVSDIN